MRKINKIFIHCSATKPDQNVGAETIRDWHVNGRGWRDIGYHFVIRRNGTVETGRDLDHDGDIFEETGAHVRGHNAGSLGICLEGGFGSREDDPFLVHFNSSQRTALAAILVVLKGAFPAATIHGHNEFAAKACPGFQVQPWLKEVGL